MSVERADVSRTGRKAAKRRITLRNQTIFDDLDPVMIAREIRARSKLGSLEAKLDSSEAKLNAAD